MNHPLNPPAMVALTIAGFDPSGGAGVVADLKTFAANNCYGVAAITALTAQNSHGVSALKPVEAKLLRETILSLLADGRVRAIKIGMVANRQNAEVVREILDANPALPSVLDPIYRSTSGRELVDENGFEYLRKELLSRVTVVTPNMEEAAALTSLKVSNVEEMKVAAHKLIAMGARNVVVTGGHLDKAVDILCEGAKLQTLAGDRMKAENLHGAGCTFSSAVAANLALGRHLEDAVVLAKAYVTEAIRKAYAIGPGLIPLNHLYRLQQSPRPADDAPPVPEATH
ncbi:MAG TPA: bifunctional hydroxymethylpyrimidine kinase/phosphomethylpyrimidine kinase [Terriglobia bacterium]|nr:bifunctional hydroxymethylpyrimidine kinase/phosphomethylpyrimidine kinase [Terriglobia bacterium]